MAAAVRRIELTDGVQMMRTPEGYSEVRILVTYMRQPLGCLSVENPGRIISAGYLRARIEEEFGGRILERWLSDQLSEAIPHTNQSSRPSVDIVICTCGRPDDLKRCLKAVSAAEYPLKTVIVVDNGDDPVRVREAADLFGARYVREERRGLDFARNAGIDAGDSEIVAFTDDDATVDPAWVDSIVKPFEEDTGIACVTGLTMPMELETEAQEMFEAYSDGGMRRGYRRQIFDRTNLPPVAAGKVGVGANMAFRRGVFARTGLFDEALDCGTPSKAGGDVDMFYRVLRMGYKICYEPRALVWHRHRRGMDELHNQLAGYSKAVYAFLTKCLVEYRDTDAIRAGIGWLRNHHLRELRDLLLLRAETSWSVVMGEIFGILSGPWAYVDSKRYASSVRARTGSPERRGRFGLRRLLGSGARRGEP